MGANLLHNMLLRELVLVALLVIVLIVFYIRYRHAGKKEYVRTRERRLAQVVSSARKQLVVVLVLLAGVLVYDRVLPHFGIGAQAAQSAQTTSSSKTVTKKPTKKQQTARLKKAESVSKQAKSLSESISKSSSSAASSSVAAASSASAASAASASSASAAAASASSAKAASASRAAAVDPKVKAVAAVRARMAQYPGEYDDTRIDGVSVLTYGTDYTGIPAYEVGLNQIQADGSVVAVHMYFYYNDGSVAKAY